MICPHCGREAQIPDEVLINVDTYGGSKLTVTKCCGRGVWVRSLKRYQIQRDDTGSKQDSWGRPLKR